MATAQLEEITRADIEGLIGTVIESRLKTAIEEYVRSNETRAKELSLIERVVRVEEELKALREIEAARFEAMEKRFESLQREMNARFEAVDKRFEAMDKRFSSIQWLIGIGFTFISILIALFGLYIK